MRRGERNGCIYQFTETENNTPNQYQVLDMHITHKHWYWVNTAKLVPTS